MAKLIYYPELKEVKPISDIDARYIGYSKYISIETKLNLKGRGITNHRSETDGTNRYSVTYNAFDRLAEKYDIALKVYLD